MLRKTLLLRKIEGKRRRRQRQKMIWLDSITDLMTEHNNNSQKVESGTSEGKGMQDNKD